NVMERRLDQDLGQIRKSLLRMAATAEGMVAEATEALIQRDSALCRRVIDRDREVDQMEMDLDEVCHRVLGCRQPTACDLRFLVAVMKITGDLERIGDSAVNIAQSVLNLNDQPQLKPYVDLPHLSELARGMVRRSLDSFVNEDPGAAAEVLQSDDEVDALYKKLFQELQGYMVEDASTVSRALHLLLIARNLERIGDYATNIAEDVIYYVDGRDVRHSVARA
ncbi:MAG TPA: phosphate signaling complex protein PhoU, partial [Thermoanaerobaculia bacterium]|nr:phosphate signaling complex protein PhoU [Thermoanaerobaculia bacterium]